MIRKLMVLAVFVATAAAAGQEEKKEVKVAKEPTLSTPNKQEAITPKLRQRKPRKSQLRAQEIGAQETSSLDDRIDNAVNCCSLLCCCAGLSYVEYLFKK